MQFALSAVMFWRRRGRRASVQSGAPRRFDGLRRVETKGWLSFNGAPCADRLRRRGRRASVQSGAPRRFDGRKGRFSKTEDCSPALSTRQAYHGAGNRLAPTAHFFEGGKTAYCNASLMQFALSAVMFWRAGFRLTALLAQID
jgi:hypothetical protein